MAPKKKSAIPDRWTDYKALGKRIPGTRFIAFKVPLKQSLQKLLPPSKAFGPLDLMQLMEKEKQELGLIIDLTFTTRYYQPEDLPDTVYYVKIFTAGHEVPNDKTILCFKKAVRAFLRDNQSNDKLIGVHCTHGLNRTGYLVCRYLIDVDGLEPGDAINLFNASRGHCIERLNYLDDLRSGPRRSNEGMEQPDQEPVRGYAKWNQFEPPPPPCPPHQRDSSSRQPPHSIHAWGPQLSSSQSFHPRAMPNHTGPRAPPNHTGPRAPPRHTLPPPPQGMWPCRPLYPDHHPFPPCPYPESLPRYRFGEAWQEPAAFRSEVREDGEHSHRKRRVRSRRKAHRDRK
ncbi:RNA/RNP complex-1-interacting phosphatase [Chanos chanos]|uniref:RNA/RNP complex-1-interacting phosphatase n=1 Tax=Chanos chanos TaxID=29144 RepID=A0A6J2UZI5_CHACN|nr:RNA/RNP complex-1-interacting phosphatase [Chanos chanos]